LVGKSIPQRKVLVIIYGQYHPKNYLSQNPNTFGLLFKLLGQQNQPVQFSNQVWELINKLPTNTETRDTIKLLKQPWKTVFDDSFYRTLYNVQIVQDLTLNEPEWPRKFIESGGVKSLVKKYQELKNQFTINPLEKTSTLRFT
jgi:hypothetical protein